MGAADVTPLGQVLLGCEIWRLQDAVADAAAAWAFAGVGDVHHAICRLDDGGLAKGGGSVSLRFDPLFQRPSFTLIHGNGNGEVVA